MTREIEVVVSDPAWVEAFQSESVRVAKALGDNCVQIHHIGSTAIPGIPAKPIIDMIVEVRDLSQVDQRSSMYMGMLGYEPRGEYGIPGRRYFVKKEGERHLFHAHIFQEGHSQVARHLRFRDYLIAHPEEARAYGELKMRLAQAFRFDPEGYMDGKDEFIRQIDEKALAWQGE